MTHALVSTRNGLFLATPQGVTLKADGWWFGITQSPEHIYAFRRGEGDLLTGKGEIFETITATEVGTGRRVPAFRHLCDANPWTHQIRWHDGVIYVCDTYHNQIQRVTDNGVKLEPLRPFRYIADVERRREFDWYRHPNSLLVDGDRVQIMCHNETAKTGRESQLAMCDTRTGNGVTLDIHGTNAHDIVDNGVDWWWCDSGQCALMMNSDAVWTAPGYFLRGLAITDDHILVGGSTISEKDARDTTSGRLWWLDRETREVVHEFEMPAHVHDIEVIG